jgi:hypothetical protein
MKLPIIFENNWVPIFLSHFSPITIGAINIWPFIFFRGKAEPVIKNHETIHSKQYLEMFIIGFWFVYLWDYVHGLIKYRGDWDGYDSLGQKAYYRLRSEQEAYANQSNLEYLDNRVKYEWLKKFRV